MTNSYRKIVSLVLYVVMILLGIISVIDSFVNIDTTISVNDSLIWIIWLLNLFIGVFFIAGGANGFLILNRNPNASQKLFANSVFPISYLIIASLVMIFVIYDRANVSIPVKGIMIIVFYFLGVFGLGIASGLKFETNKIVKITVGEISLFVIFVVYLINATSADTTSALSIIVLILFIFCLIGFMVQIPLLTSKYDVGIEPTKSVQSANEQFTNEIPRAAEEIKAEPAPVSKPQKNTGESPIEKLRELKQLKDEGILDEEEFKKLAQKYKDQL